MPLTSLYCIAIGDELLDGRTREGNAAFAGRMARQLGASMTGVQIVEDDLDSIINAVLDATHRAQIVVTSGGMGPTLDDRTRDALAGCANVGLRFDPEAEARLLEKYRAKGRTPSATNLRQAHFPEGARIIENPHGTADCFELVVRDVPIVALPGVPHEFRALFESEIASRFPGRAAAFFLPLHVCGMGESDIAERVESASMQNVKVTYRPRFPIVEVELSGAKTDVAAAAASVHEVLDELLLPIGATTATEALFQLLQETDSTIATAESCTGGLIAKQLTDLPGASEIFPGGTVVYANQMKTRLAGVPESMLIEHGAVSRPVASQLAEGTRERFDADLALAVTGIAGPRRRNPRQTRRHGLHRARKRRRNRGIALPLRRPLP